MSVRHASHLLVGATATALAASTLALATQGTASAEPATTSYLCTFPELDEVDVPLTVNVANLPTRLPVGIPVPANAWSLTASLHFDEMTTSYLVGHTNAIIAKIPELELLLADKPVPAGLTSGVEALPVGEALDVPMTGANGEFTPKFWADDLSLDMPEELTLDLSKGDGTPLFTVECEWGDGDLGSLGEISVVKQSASMTRKLLKKPVKTTKRPKLLVTVVTEADENAQGEVMAAIGGRNLAVGELVDGRVTIKLPKLEAGKHQVTLTYMGSKLVDKSTTNLTVKVVVPPRH